MSYKDLQARKVNIEGWTKLIKVFENKVKRGAQISKWEVNLYPILETYEFNAMYDMAC